jgi:hypothetical protein
MEEDLNTIMHKTESLYPPFVLNKERFFQKTNFRSNTKRLDVFANLTKNAENTSTSVSSNDSFSTVKQVKNLSKSSFMANFNAKNSPHNVARNGLSCDKRNLMGFGLCAQNPVAANNFQQNGNSPVSNINTFNTNINNNLCNPFFNQIGFYPASFLNKTSAN